MNKKPKYLAAISSYTVLYAPVVLFFLLPHTPDYILHTPKTQIFILVYKTFLVSK